ncbi:N-acetylglucosamine-6-phosphate deacetylase [Aquicella siphonis]|uniref:N-acetylglucosamine-6-phosphate deacetylase n=1 Tax=Aquicella siphonis TaxID=254247 RepID=A0A5E4PES6_9COXI|nr:N-acetylglucosamine-6-phosphate deacetylase [Aquicella siphonis]VVC75115.1 N-acetylglucosamine-6-phosphate deacetylase [Aquicella siphonis]
MTESNRIIFSGMQILVGNEWSLEHAVVVEEGIIKAVLPADMIGHQLPAKQVVYSPHHYLIPGLIDLHIHGAGGHDVMDGNEKALRGICETLASEGVTGFLATTMTAPVAKLESVLSAIAAFMPGREGAAILGIHLEGPFISRDKMGAQAGDHVALPNPEWVQRWHEMTRGAFKLMTLAPELTDVIPMIKTLRRLGVTSSVGHTNAGYAETCHALAAGCSHATHLFNAMRGLHHREPGAAGALLLSDKVNVELIVDGLHLHPAVVDLAWRLKGTDRIVLVTDAMRAKCLGDGAFELGGHTVTVHAGCAALPDGTLAGSTLRMPQAIRNMAQYTECSLADAVRMASANPARILGLDGRKGSIENGKDADLVVMDSAFEVELTLRGGKEVFKKHA